MRQDSITSIISLVTKQSGVTSIWEIERKFLVGATPADLECFPHEHIRQGYIAYTREGTEVRVRHKGGRFFETVKQGAGVRRAEVELSLSEEQFEALWPFTEGKRLEKVRYAIPYDHLTIELDVYLGPLEGLCTAEVEFPSEEASEAFQPPSWFGREITEDPGYKNRTLAMHGLPEEGEDGGEV